MPLAEPLVSPLANVRADRIGRFLAAYVGVGGAVSLAGWVLDVQRLTDWFGTGISMQPNTAIVAMVTSLAVLALMRCHWWTARSLAAVALVIAGTAIYENFAGVNFPTTSMLLFDRPWGGRSTGAPGLMGIPAGTSWSLLAVAIVVQSQRAIPRRVVPLLALLVAVIGATAVTGYLFGADQLFELTRRTAIAFQTATMVVAAAIAVLSTARDREPMLTMLEDSAVGPVARRMLPAIATIALVLGWVNIRGLDAGLYDARMGTATMTILLTVVTGIVLWKTVRAASRRERREARRKDEFLATLAHELRNPLAPLSNAATLLSRLNRGDMQGEQATATIERQVRHMVRLIDDLLDVSRISQNKLVLQREVIDLVPIIRHALESATPSIAAARLESAVALPEAAYVVGDADRLAQVFGNILNNACKFTPAGGTISVDASVEEGTVVIRFRDTGIGIPVAMLERIFEPFTQVDVSLERNHSGLGIGLNLVRQLVGMHGGTVRATSGGDGKGTTFTVRLPAVAAPPAPAIVPRAETAPPRNNRRVLVVDDNRDAADSLAMILQMAGSDTHVAYHGAGALDAARDHAPDVILLDIGLPGMSGYDVCRELRRREGGNAMRIIALTGWGQASDRDAARDAGFDGHLVKPADHATLLAMLAEPSRE